MSAEPMDGNGAIVSLVGLSKSYGDFQAVSDLSVEVRPGERFALLGPNGAGKTTTIRMLMGILEPSSGTASVRGLDCFKDRAAVMGSVGYLPDDPIFYDYLRGREVIDFVQRMRGLCDEEVGERRKGLVERFDLGKDLEEYAVNYSKGMKKKLAIICALLHDPDLLILDEPTNGLDPYATRLFHELIRERADTGKSVFFSTHLLDQAERLCHRVGILEAGKLAACGPLDELKAQLAPGGSLEEIFFAVTEDREA
ncbi:MAG: ABC transporter ATP-binding protein [Planctomycetota bacterium]|jgi:ABC-2 type transport system ATP-binding protein